MNAFRFELNQTATINTSGEQGTVIARAEYVASENAYLLRYKDADGSAVERWWGDSALAA